MRTTRALSPPRCQRGVYAIEFAMVFLIFFTLLYAVICYGMLFAFRLGLQNAAEDGARAALRYQSSIENRWKHAEQVAYAQSRWMPGIRKEDVSARICRVEGVTQCTPIACGPAWNQRCQVEVVVPANNVGSMLPPLPSFAVPDQLAGKASMLLELR